MFNYKLTENFCLSEFFRTNQGLIYECELVANMCVILRNIILHSQDSSHKLLDISRNIIELAKFLQVFRNRFNVPIKIISGFRTDSLNKKVGGVETSKHIYGKAVDIYFSGYQTYLNPIKFPCGSKHTPAKIDLMCQYLKEAKHVGTLSELIFHENYIHIAL